MKEIGVREAKSALTYWLASAQDENVLITTHGKPTALLVGVIGRDLNRLIKSISKISRGAAARLAKR